MKKPVATTNKSPSRSGFIVCVLWSSTNGRDLRIWRRLLWYILYNWCLANLLLPIYCKRWGRGIARHLRALKCWWANTFLIQTRNDQLNYNLTAHNKTLSFSCRDRGGDVPAPDTHTHFRYTFPQVVLVSVARWYLSAWQVRWRISRGH